MLIPVDLSCWAMKNLNSGKIPNVVKVALLLGYDRSVS